MPAEVPKRQRVKTTEFSSNSLWIPGHAAAHHQAVKSDVASTRLRMASLDDQESLVARIFGCWHVRAVALRAIQVSVGPWIAGSYRASASVPPSTPVDQVGLQSARNLDHLSEVQVEALIHVQASPRGMSRSASETRGPAMRVQLHW